MTYVELIEAIDSAVIDWYGKTGCECEKDELADEWIDAALGININSREPYGLTAPEVKEGVFAGMDRWHAVHPDRLRAALANESEELQDYVFDGVNEADIMRQARGDVAKAVQLCKDAMQAEMVAKEVK